MESRFFTADACESCKPTWAIDPLATQLLLFEACGCPAEVSAVPSVLVLGRRDPRCVPRYHGNGSAPTRGLAPLLTTFVGVILQDRGVVRGLRFPNGGGASSANLHESVYLLEVLGKCTALIICRCSPPIPGQAREDLGVSSKDQTMRCQDTQAHKHTLIHANLSQAIVRSR
jgi:hypothetical protein